MRHQRIKPNALTAAIRAALGLYTPSFVRFQRPDGSFIVVEV